MALIKCPECEKEVSDSAKCCPNCGCPIKSHIRTSNSKEITDWQDEDSLDVGEKYTEYSWEDKKGMDIRL